MQSGPSGFVLVGLTPSGMARTQGGSSMRYPSFGVRERKALNNIGSSVRLSRGLRESWMNPD